MLVRHLVVPSVLLFMLVAARAESAEPPGRLSRTDFNRRAAELALPLFWRGDANGNNSLDPEELVVLWGVAGSARQGDYVVSTGLGARFTKKFRDAYGLMSAPARVADLTSAESRRRQAVLEELAQGRPTLVETDFSAGPTEDKALVRNILAAAAVIERIYARQMGVSQWRGQVSAADSASRMLMYRNQGPFCLAPKTEKNPDCNALPGRPRKRSGLYPENIQRDSGPGFCEVLQARPDARTLMSAFVVVKARPGGRSAGDAATDELVAVPYNVVYQREMAQVSTLLRSAAAAIRDPKEAALRAYLSAAAGSFLTNDWLPADEAWARMNAGNSKWYLRIGPDENYEEPCSRKSLFHVSFARINPDGLEWQRRLEPRKSGMEAALARLAGPPYEARAVTFHLPDFIDIVLNAGESREPAGAVIGQSLPNGGPVANEGRGRTVAMVNLYTDKDSEDSWAAVLSSLYCRETMNKTVFDPKADVMSSVLHEAAHNLGPSHEYRVNGSTAAEIFGGPLASMLEELKAQTSALWFADWLVGQGVIDQAAADRAHLHDVGWAFGHISRGMRDAEGKSKPYSQLSAIQMGVLEEAGVLRWRAEQMAANGADKGCFDVDLGEWRGVAEKLEARVLHIKAAGDKRDAEALTAEFVDAKGGWANTMDTIRERYLRTPRASFVYAIRH
jgi:hypothetical protein